MAWWITSWSIYTLITCICFMNIYTREDVLKRDLEEVWEKTFARFCIKYIVPFTWPVIVPLAFFLNWRKNGT